MARPIEYDKENVLTSAMLVFWKNGYEASSMKMLIEATGLTSRSMYNIFGSKKGLLEAALNWYYEIAIKKSIERLKKENGLEAIRNFFEVLAKRETKNGCLFVNICSDRFNIDEVSLEIVDNYFNTLEEIFELKLEYAVKNEKYKCDNVSDRAKQLIVIVQGLSVYSKTVKEQEDNRKMVKSFLEVLEI